MRNVRQPVRFADATTALIDAGERVFLEVGPHPVLSGNIKEILLRKGITGTSIGTLQPRQPTTTPACGRRWPTSTSPVPWTPTTPRAPPPASPPHRPLPAHQFQRQRLWSIEQAAADDQPRHQ